ncbi:MAG: YciI family protein [Acidimicrobiales bacterium]
MKYVLVYYGGGMAEGEAAQAKAMQAWGAWFGRLGAAVVDGGNPFSGTVCNLSADGAVADGPIGVPATGYSVIEADSLAAAVDLAKGCPILEGNGQIAVYETVPM